MWNLSSDSNNNNEKKEEKTAKSGFLIVKEGSNGEQRFNPYFLNESEKIDIVMKLITKLSQLHEQAKKVDNNDINWGMIAIKVLEGNQFDVTLDKSCLTEKKAKSFFSLGKSKDADQVSCVLEALKFGLELDNPMVINHVAQFLGRGDYSKKHLMKLLQDLEKDKQYVNMGMQIFENGQVPKAPKDKKLFCVLIHNVRDGIGDFMHAWDFAQRNQLQLKSQGYTLVALVLYFTSDETKTTLRPDESKAIFNRGKEVQTRLDSSQSPFDRFLCFVGTETGQVPPEALEEWKKSNKQVLKELRKNTAGAVEIAYPNPVMRALLPNHVNVVKSYQYGYRSPMIPSLSFAPMGFTSQYDYHGYGIKILTPSSSMSNETKLCSLTKNEPHFLAELLNSQEVDEKQAKLYLQTHHFMPGYLQSKNAACGFILAHIMRHQKDGKPCDFLLPGGVVDEATIRKMLHKAGFRDEEVAFINANSKDFYPDAKIRIFAYRIKEDEDYQKLFEISNDGAGASGDNSITLVFSSQHLPWYEYKSGPIGDFYDRQFFSLINQCLQEAEHLEDKKLIAGMKQLSAYFHHLNRFRTLNEHADTPETGKKLLIYEDPFVWEKEKGIMESEEFFAYCQRLAELSNQPDLQKAWSYVSAHIKKNNFYDKYDHVIKASIIPTLFGPEQFIKEYISNSAEMQNLLFHEAIGLHEIVGMKPDFFGLLAEKNITELLCRRMLSCEALKMLQGELLSGNPEQNIPRLKNMLFELALSGSEQKKFLKSPLLIVALYTDMIDLKTFMENKKWLLKLSSKELSSTIAQSEKLPKVIELAARKPNNQHLLKALLDVYLTASPDKASLLIQKLLQQSSTEKEYTEYLNSLSNPYFSTTPMIHNSKNPYHQKHSSTSGGSIDLKEGKKLETKEEKQLQSTSNNNNDVQEEQEKSKKGSSNEGKDIYRKQI